MGTNQYERNIFEFLAQQLALRHHQVTTVKPILIPEEPRLVKPKLHLVKEKTLKNLLPRELSDALQKAYDETPWKNEYEEEDYDEVYWKAHNASCYKMLNSNLMDTIRKETVDVAIVYAGNPCQLAITHVLAIPVIHFDLEGEFPRKKAHPVQRITKSFLIFCFKLPHHALSRFRNGLCYMREYLVQGGIPLLAKFLSKKFRQLDDPITSMFAEDYYLKKKFPNFPSSNELLRSSSLFFANTDPLLEFPRALSPKIIPVGGLHVDQPKPLFAPWNTSIESAQDGLIVVSLGTQANHAYMTESQAKAILGALSKLTTYRIYWRIGHKVELKNVTEDNVPSHINLTAFIPQNDLLAHKSCKLLVTNGGMSSVMEAVAHGVPIVGIPLYGSNRHNLKKVVAKGLGLTVSKKELREDKLLNTMKSVLQGSRFTKVAKEMSKDFRSRPSTPFEAALHYIEVVGRHRSSGFYGATPVNPLLTLNLDFLTMILLVTYIVTYLFVQSLLSICHRSSIPSIVVTADENSKKLRSKKEN
nr:UDP-glucuronosyl UDP-glucosyltransferase domain containing protein [Haemonchus contortus]